MSLLSLTVQSMSLMRIARQPIAVKFAKAGLLRTAYCRVGASVIYVGLGISGLFRLPQTAMAAFIALVVVQGMWQLNGLLDSRLSHRLREHVECR